MKIDLLYGPACFFFLFVAFFEPAAANLNVTHRGSVHFNYDASSAFSEDGAMVERLDGSSANFRVLGHSKDAQDFFVTFSSESVNGGSRNMRKGKSSLAYNLFADASLTNTLLGIPIAQTSQVLSDTIKAGGKHQTVPLSYYLAIPKGQFTSSGTYRDRVALRLYKGKIDGASQEISTRMINYFIHVPSLIRLTVGEPGRVGWGQHYLPLDFGLLKEGSERSFILRVESNASYFLQVQSKNGGYLQPVSGNAKNNSTQSVPYTLTLGSKAVDVTQGPFTLLESVESRAGEKEIEGNILIGDIDQRMEGAYEDSLYLTIKAVH